MSIARKPYPSDVSDDEGALVAPWLTLLPEEAGQREHPSREVVDGLRCTVETGAPWRWMRHDLPPRAAVCRQAQRWSAVGCFERLAQDLRAVLRLAAGRSPEPGAAVLDGRTWRSSPEGGGRAGYDGTGRKRGSRPQTAVDTPGHLLALHVTPANADDRAEVGRLAEAVQAATGGSVSLACVDQGFSGPRPAAAAPEHGIELEVVGLPEAGRGVVLLPRRWVVQRSFARIIRSAASSGTASPTPAPWHTSTWPPSPASCSARPLHRPAVHDSL